MLRALLGGVMADSSLQVGKSTCGQALGAWASGEGSKPRKQPSPSLCPCRYSEEETRQKVRTFRQMLMEKEGMLTREDRPGSHM